MNLPRTNPANNRARLRVKLACSVALLGLLAAPAWGQEAAPPDEAADVIVVTGIGPARATGELIASTSVLEQADVQDRLAGGLGDTLSGLPGVSTTAFGPGASRPIIRGLGAERVQVLANGIGVIDASAASPDHAVTGDPLGAEHIEILRGPAALAYGGGATGGVVNVIDGLIVEKLPQKSFSGSVYGAYTTVDEGTQGAAHLTASAGPFVAVLNAAALNADDTRIPGYALSSTARQEAINGGANPADFARDKLPNSAVENSSISGGLSWVGDNAFLGGAVRHLENTYGIVAEEEAFIDMAQDRYDLRGGVNFDTGLLKTLRLSGSKVDYEHTEFEGPGEPGTRFTNEGWEGRLEAGHAAIMGLEGSLGIQASSKDFAAFGDEALIGPTTTDALGVFVFETLDKGQWGAEGGLRHDEVSIDNIDNGKREFEAWNGSFGAHVHLSDQIFLGASVALTERAPTDLELFANGPHPATGQFEIGDGALKTEKGVNYELSARWEGDDLNVSGSLYRFDFNRFIYLEDTGTIDAGADLPIFQIVQAGAVFDGFELSADKKLGELWGADWKADGSADLVRARLDAGGNLPLIPPLTLNAGLEAKWDTFNARVETQYAASQDDVAAFETPTDSYLTFDARVGIDLTSKVRLMLEARNLTDEEVRVHASPLKDIAPMAGRNFRVALRAEF